MEEIILGSRDTAIESPGIEGLAQLLLEPRAGEDDTRPILLGCTGAPELRPTRVSLRQLRHLILRVAAVMEARGIRPGDTVALIRLPRTNETLTAIVYLALSAFGIRVLFPMYVVLPELESWLRVTSARLVLASATEVEELAVKEPDVATSRAVRAAAARAGLPFVCIYRDLGVVGALDEAPDASPAPDDPAVARLLATGKSDAECLVLTTSGTSGTSKLVRYRQGAFLRCCASWEAAGLFRPDRLGGRSLCLLLGHSMGLRALWNAVWTREAICLITPEWFAEYPERVRSLLIDMKPRHTTGGPAVFSTLLELARIYPDLKEICFRDLTCLVSSGAPFSSALARRVKEAFGLPLHNGLGLTETMQVACTVAGGTPPSLGRPLPGVRLRLTRDDSLPPRAYRLEVATPFGFAGYLGGEPAGDWFDSGDLVERLPDETIEYLGRERWDFLNDGFGVKISRVRLDELYGGGPHIIEAFPLQHEPGLAAIVFVGAGPAGGADGVVVDARILRELRGFFESKLERLRGTLEEMEFRHLAVGRCVAVAADPPRTRKGNVKHSEIEARYAPLIERLTARYREAPGVMRIDLARYAGSTSVRLTAPRRGAFLHLLDLDRRYVRARGDRLYDRTERGEREVIDFVGGFGGNLLGHAHPKLAAVLADVAADGSVPIADQGSERSPQADLARTLALRVGEHTGQAYVVRLGSTGAEAVEMGIAHAALEREEALERLIRDQRRRFGGTHPDRVREVVAEATRRVRAGPLALLALEHAFHGCSLGARAALGRACDRIPFESIMGIEPIFVPVEAKGDIGALVERERIDVPILAEQDGRIVDATARFSRIVAALVEPIQGEGGIRVVPPQRLAELSGHGFPLIADEIQCGLGRSGRFLASGDVPADYFIFGKALGGGVAKISALLVENRRYVPRFDELYESTFAGDTLSARAASRALEVIDAEDIPGRCRERGEILRARLEEVHARHPSVVSEIRGAGLMLGIALDRNAGDASYALRALSREDFLGAMAAAYLLAVHGVRVLPSLSAPDVLRIEPSAFIDDAAITQLVAGLDALCVALERGDVAALVSFLARPEDALRAETSFKMSLPSFTSVIEPPKPGAVRVAFVSHFVFPERELAMAEPSLRALSMAARRSLFDRLSAMLEMKPTMGFGRNLFGGRIWFASLVMAVDGATLERAHASGEARVETGRIQEAVDRAAALGCTAVALGGYTSIITRNGLGVLPPPGVRVSTGNTFASIVEARRLFDACRARGIDPGRARVAVVGATGNIGASLARRLALGPTPFRELLLVGRRTAALEQLRGRLHAAAPACEIGVSIDLDALRSCDAVAVAVGTNEPLVYPQHLATDRPVLLADVSVPSVLSANVRALPNVTLIPQAGTVRVPGEPDFVISSHTPAGTAFCCAAEVMLLGLEPERTAGLTLTGDIQPESMRVLEELGELHGLLSGTAGTEVGFRA